MNIATRSARANTGAPSVTRGCPGSFPATVKPWNVQDDGARPGGRDDGRGRGSRRGARRWLSGRCREIDPARRRRPAVAAARGRPPLVLDLGVREDAEARDSPPRPAALHGAATLAGRDGCSSATTRSRRVSARAFAVWPDGTLDRLNRLAGLHPRAPSSSCTSASRSTGASRARARPGGGREAEPDTLVRRRRRQPALPAVRPEAARLRRRAPRLPERIRAPPSRPRSCATLERACAGERLGGASALRRRAAAARAASSPQRGCSARQHAHRADDAEAQVAAAVGLLRQGTPRAGVLAARPAHEAISRRRRPCGSISACCSCGRGR